MHRDDDGIMSRSSRNGVDVGTVTRRVSIVDLASCSFVMADGSC